MLYSVIGERCTSRTEAWSRRRAERLLSLGQWGVGRSEGRGGWWWETKTKKKGCRVPRASRRLRVEVRKGNLMGNLDESWGILEDLAWWTTCMLVDHMHGPWWTIDGRRGHFSHLGPPDINFCQNFGCGSRKTAYVTVRKRFVFVFFLGGPAPRDRRGGH